MKNAKISLREYLDSGKDRLYIGGKFYEGLEDYIGYITNYICEEAPDLEELEDYEIPVIYGTEYEKIELDAENIIEMLEYESGAYDYTMGEAAVGFIEAFVKEYNEKYAEISIAPDKNTIIKLTKEQENKILAAVYEALEKASAAL